MRFVIFFLVILTFSPMASAQILIEDPTRGQSGSRLPTSGNVEGQPRTGKSAAVDYFRARRENKPERRETQPQRTVAAAGERILSLHVGSFISDKQHRWGRLASEDDVGELMLGVTYRVGEWVSSMDLNIRTELVSYKIDGEHPLKLSFMPIVQFPDARSSFPLYFGAGIGVGVFFEQVRDESDLSLDYALIVGARFWDIFPSGTGLFVEAGLKGQVHLLSSGQHEGVFLAGGAVFSF